MKESPRSVSYRVSWPEPHTHQFHVEVTFPGPLPETLDLRMPAWNPGSYLIREFSRHVSDVVAEGPGGEGCKVEQTAKDTWRIDQASKGVTVRYRVYAHELTVRTSHLDASHAFFNGVALFLFSEECRTLPARLILELPDEWRVSTGLEPAEGPEVAWLAEDYDHLVDCPVEAGTHETLTFSVRDVPHEVAIWGQGNYDPEKVKSDLAAIVEASAQMFNGLPYDRYLFIVHLSDGRGGGLEHANSSVLNYPALGFVPQREYEGFLQLASHELFHVWNVKRIRPKAFTPYNYHEENYTRLLWIMEGLTDYYAVLLCRRAGLISPERFLQIWAERITRLNRTPGRFLQSLEASSWDTWVKLYRPGENSVNNTVSYYLKGSLIGVVLDVEIRTRSKDGSSLDDVMRALFLAASEGSVLDENAFAEIVSTVTGVDVRDLLGSYVSGTEEVDFAAHFLKSGVQLKARPQEGSVDRGGKPGTDAEGEPVVNRGYFGANLITKEGGLQVQSVPLGSPAGRDGLYPGDELLAIDGWRLRSSKALEVQLARLKPTETVIATISRRDRIVNLPVTLEARPLDTVWFEINDDADSDEKSRYEDWVGGTFEVKA